MLLRVLLALALFAPSASALAHALETARHEANHPVCSASGTHLDSGSNHTHHEESNCAQCPRPFSAGFQAAPTLQASASPSFIKTPGASRPAAVPLLPRPGRGPPSA